MFRIETPTNEDVLEDCWVSNKVFVYLTESFAYVVAAVGRSPGTVGRAELGKAFSALGIQSSLYPGCYTWDLEQILLFQPSPAG